MRLRGNTAVGTWRAARAHALLHVVAQPSHFARMERWLKGSVRRAPAAHGAQSAVRLGCVRACQAVGWSSTWKREQAVRSSTASTVRIVPKPTSHSSSTGSRSCSHSNVAGGWTLLRNLRAPLTVAHCSSSARRCDSSGATCNGPRGMGRGCRACGTLAHERSPELRLNALSAFYDTYR